jgi:hypothetical protein
MLMNVCSVLQRRVVKLGCRKGNDDLSNCVRHNLPKYAATLLNNLGITAFATGEIIPLFSTEQNMRVLYPLSRDLASSRLQSAKLDRTNEDGQLSGFQIYARLQQSRSWTCPGAVCAFWPQTQSGAFLGLLKAPPGWNRMRRSALACEGSH